MINPLTIPINNIDENFNFSQKVEIENTKYVFRFFWNFRAEYWNIEIKDDFGDILLSGIKMVVNYDLMKFHAIDGLPKGSLILFDTLGTSKECEFKELGKRCILLYIGV